MLPIRVHVDGDGVRRAVAVRLQRQGVVSERHARREVRSERTYGMHRLIAPSASPGLSPCFRSSRSTGVGGTSSFPPPSLAFSFPFSAPRFSSSATLAPLVRGDSTRTFFFSRASDGAHAPTTAVVPRRRKMPCVGWSEG